MVAPWRPALRASVWARSYPSLLFPLFTGTSSGTHPYGGQLKSTPEGLAASPICPSAPVPASRYSNASGQRPRVMQVRGGYARAEEAGITFFLFFAQVLQRFRVLFPVAAVEGFDGELRDGRVEAADVDVDAVRV